MIYLKYGESEVISASRNEVKLKNDECKNGIAGCSRFNICNMHYMSHLCTTVAFILLNVRDI